MSRLATTVRLGVGAIVLSAFHIVAAPPRALAAPGDFDPSFGTAGMFAVAGGRPGSSTAQVEIASDGKVVVAVDDSPGSAFVARLEPDGTLDPSFGAGGRLLNPLRAGPNETLVSQRMALSADREVVLYGWIRDDATGQGRLVVARVDAAGRLDPSFDGNGGVPIPSRYAGLVKLVRQPDGKVLGVGVGSDDGGRSAVLVVRLDASGGFDPSFGDGGKIVAQLDTGDVPISSGYDLVVQPDGKILIEGLFARDSPLFQGVPLVHGVFLARFAADGSGVDTTFGEDGKFVIPLPQTFPYSSSELFALALQSDGKIVIGGISRGTKGGCALIGRIGADGHGLDGAFDGIGMQEICVGGVPFFRRSSVAQLLLPPDGTIVAVGSTSDDGSGKPRGFVTRLRLDGTFDPTFGPSDGTVIEQVAPLGSLFGVAALQPDGKIVVGGRDDPGVASRALVARLILDEPPSAGCGTDRVPRGIKRRLRRASRSIDRAAVTRNASRRERLLGRAGKALEQVIRAIDRTELRKRRALSATCAAALRRDTKAAQARLTTIGT